MKFQSNSRRFRTIFWMGVAVISVIIGTASSAPKCENSPDEFSIGKGGNKEITSCNLIAAQSEEDRVKDCKKSKISKKCPGLCRKDKCPCTDFPIAFTFELATGEIQTQSCEEVASLGKSRREKKCNREEIAEKCPSICDEDCGEFGPCDNFDGEFTFKSGKGGDGDEETITCEKVESLDEKGQSNKCNKDEIFENCPGICDKECIINDCEDVFGSFSFQDKGEDEETTCNDVSSLEKKDRDKKCKKNEIFENCPSVCDEECIIIDCEDVSGTFSFKDKGEDAETTCDDVSSLEKKDRDKKCKKDKILENCPSVCEEECIIIDCEDVSGSFSFKNKGEDEETTCDDVSSLEKKEKDKKCKKDKILENCPSVCEEECST